MFAFEQYVSRQFKNKIRFFTRMEEKFVNSKLASHFHTISIIHQSSCSNTLERTCMVERWHTIIRELGMTMLFHSGDPLFLLIEAFTNNVYLINRLPLSTFSFNTPYFALHGSHLDYPYMCLDQDVFLTLGTYNITSLIQKLFYVSLCVATVT